MNRGSIMKPASVPLLSRVLVILTRSVPQNVSILTVLRRGRRRETGLSVCCLWD